MTNRCMDGTFTLNTFNVSVRTAIRTIAGGGRFFNKKNKKLYKTETNKKEESLCSLTFGMIEELERLDVERKLGDTVVEEEVYGVSVELERERLQERYVVGHHFLVGEVELVQYDVVYVVVREEEVFSIKTNNK